MTTFLLNEGYGNESLDCTIQVNIDQYPFKDICEK